MRKTSEMPSPALVMATLALVAAMTGAAVASPGGTTSKLTKSKVKKIANKQITKAAPGLSVAHANTAGTANTATGAENANALDGLDSTAFPRIVATETVNRDLGSIPGNACQSQILTSGSFSGVEPGDVSLVFPTGSIPPFVPFGTRQNTAGQAAFTICNYSESASGDPPPLDFKVMVLR
jgi:hypothetical protein